MHDWYSHGVYVVLTSILRIDVYMISRTACD